VSAPPPPPPPAAPGPWRAKITRRGRFGWTVHVSNGGLWAYGPDGGDYHWFGSRERVARKAARLVDRLNAPSSAEQFTVWGGGQ